MTQIAYNVRVSNPWKIAKSAPPLQKGEVHIWRAFLDWPTSAISSALAILSEEEKKRAQRFVFEEHRALFTASHAVLRYILSAYTQQSAAELQFATTSHGKPHLVNPPAGLDLRFNMSDSKQLAVYAITLNREVGVDIEWMKPNIDCEGIAKRFFSQEEQEQLLALPLNERRESFYRCWSRKEAYIKVIGQGLSFPLGEFSVSLRPEGMNNLLSVHHDANQAKRWALGSLNIETEYASAIAVEGEISQIHTFEWCL